MTVPTFIVLTPPGLRLGLLSCLPMTRRTATDGGDEQMFGADKQVPPREQSD